MPDELEFTTAECWECGQTVETVPVHLSDYEWRCGDCTPDLDWTCDGEKIFDD